MYFLRLGLSLGKLSGRLTLPTIAAVVAGAVVTVGLLVVVGALQVTSAQVDRLTGREPITGADSGPIVLHYSDTYAFATVERFVVAELDTSSPTPPGLDHLPQEGEVFVSPALLEAAMTRPEIMTSLPGQIVGVVGDPGLRAPNELVAWVGVDVTGVEASHISGFGDKELVPEFLAAGYGWFYATAGFLLLGVPMLVLISLAARVASRVRIRQVSTLRAIGLSAMRIGLLFSIGFGIPTLVGSMLGTLATPMLFKFVANNGSSWYSFFLEDVSLTYSIRVVAILVPVLVAVLVGWITIARVFRDPIPMRPSSLSVAPSRVGWWFFGLAIVTIVLLALPVEISPPFALLLVFFASVGSAVGLAVGLDQAIRGFGRFWARHSKRVSGLLVSRQIEHSSSGRSRLTTAVAIGLFVLLLLGPAQTLLGGDELFELQVVQEQEAGGRSLIQVEVPLGTSLDELRDHVAVQGVYPIARLFEPGSGEALGDGVLIASCAEVVRIAVAQDVVCPTEPFIISSGLLSDYPESVVVRQASTGSDIEIKPKEMLDLGIPVDDNLEGIVVVQPDHLSHFDLADLQVGRYLIALDIGTSARDNVSAAIRGLAPSANIIDAIQVNVGGSRRLAPLLVFLRVLAGAGLFLMLCGASLAAADVLNERALQFAALRRSGVPLGTIRTVHVVSVLASGVIGVLVATAFAIGIGLALRARLGLAVFGSVGEALSYFAAACVLWVVIAFLSTLGLGLSVEASQDRPG